MSDSPSTPTPHASEQPGATIGRYKLLEKIGEGGMGTIWMAEQREPVKRRVALKIIKLGMDTKQVIARFDAERQALALMDHPHIAKVFDAGATESGRPYFVMEFIKGVPIVDYCDSERLDMKARLDLFTKVCHAIQHAHHKGIIHRDIKPSNVLVTMMDGAPIPKVIDFGIAKATNSELTTKTLFTEHRQMIGTPAYMSPEQAEMSGLDIDTRSDVYSLGVLLYEILTGTTPFDTKSLLAAGHAEMMRAIREDEPHTPSRRISSLGDTGTRTAQQRQVDLKRLGAQLRGDLDWIVMKCLEKDRTRRYETANGLAADINRHLRSEPVAASPPGTRYKLEKFVRRNRGIVAATTVVVVVLVLGAAGTTKGLVRALDEKARADVEADKAKRAAESEAAAKDEAQQNERDALAAATSAEAAQKEEESARKRAETINEFVLTTLRAGDAINPGGGQDVTILAAMDRAIADLDSGRFKDDPATEAGLKGTIGVILRNNGRLQQAEELLTQLVETRRRLSKGDSQDVSWAMNELALTQQKLGRKTEAKKLFVAALEMDQRHLRGDHAALTRGLVNLAGVLAPEEAEPLLRQALAMDRRRCDGDCSDVAIDLGNLASILRELGRPKEADPLFTEALEMCQRIHEGDHPNLARALDNLAKTRLDLGRPEEAVDLLARAVAMQQRLFHGDHPDVAIGLNNLACAHVILGRLAEAEPLFAQALAMRQRLLHGDHESVASELTYLASVRQQMGRPADAEPLFAQALAMRQRLHEGDCLEVAASLRQLASARLEMGRPAEAETPAAQALEMYQRLRDGDDRDVALGLFDLARVREALGRLTEAEPLYEKAMAMFARQLPADHRDLLGSRNKLAFVFFSLGKVEKAAALYEEVLKRQLVTLGRRHRETLMTIGNLGVNYALAGRFAEAIPLLEEAHREGRQYPELGFVGPQMIQVLSDAADPRNPDDAKKVVALARDLIGNARDTMPPGSPELAGLLANCGLGLLGVEVWDAAEALLRECLAIRENSGPNSWKTFNTKSMLGGALLGQRRYAEAEPLLLAGYRGMKEREATIEAGGRVRILQALERLVQLCEAKGDAAEAAAWRAKRDEARATGSRPSTRESKR